MKKLFIIGLSLLLVIFSFTSSNLVQSVEIRNDRFIARGEREDSPYLDFSEIYEDGKFTKCIVNTISNGEKVFDIYMVSNYRQSDADFSEFTDSKGVKHHYAWRNDVCWWIDLRDFNIFLPLADGSKTQATYVEFGWCNCLCSENSHYVINFLTEQSVGEGKVKGKAYITSLTKAE